MLGTVAIYAGMLSDGTILDWHTPPPGKTEFLDIYGQPGLRSGFLLEHWSGGQTYNTTFKDIFSWSNTGRGFHFLQYNAGPPINASMDHATIVNNGLDAAALQDGYGIDAMKEHLDVMTVTNSRIDTIRDVQLNNYPSITGEGAKIENRYIDGVLTNQPLWPWPMEDIEQR